MKIWHVPYKDLFSPETYKLYALETKHTLADRYREYFVDSGQQGDFIAEFINYVHVSKTGSERKQERI